MNSSARVFSEMNYSNDDELNPFLVEHRCEGVFEGDEMVQMYNYIYYEIGAADDYYWARAYLDAIEEVSIFGPFSDTTFREKLDNPIDARVVSYFRRRYRRLQKLGEQGYESIPTHYP